MRIFLCRGKVLITMSDISNEPKDEVAEAKIQTGSIVVGKKTSKFKKYLIPGLAVLLIGLAGLAGWWFFVRGDSATNNVAFSIDGKDYSKQEINMLIEFPVLVGTSKEDAAKQAFDMYKKQAAAQKTGIVIEQTAIEAERKELYPNYSDDLDENTKNWMNLVSYDSALNKLSNQTSVYTDATGYIYIFWFGKNIVYDPIGTNPDYGNDDAIAKDREYADSRAKYYYNQIESGSMSADKALEEIKSDPKLGLTDGNSDNISIKFDSISSNLAPNSKLLYVPQDILNQVIKVSSNQGLDSIRTATISNQEDIPEGSQAQNPEVLYYFIYIDKPATKSFDMNQYSSNLETINTQYWGIE